MTLDFTGQPWAHSQARTEHMMMVYPKNKTIVGDGTYEPLRSLAQERTIVAAGNNPLLRCLLGMKKARRISTDWSFFTWQCELRHKQRGRFATHPVAPDTAS